MSTTKHTKKIAREFESDSLLESDLEAENAALDAAIVKLREDHEKREHVFSRAVSFWSCEMVGLQVPLVEVEVHASHGLPHVDIVGLAETAVRESKQRVRSAILASRIEYPEEKMTINLAPASLKKMGTYLDLPIALGLLIAAEKIEVSPLLPFSNLLFVGELSLSGNLRPMRGILNVAMAARERGFHGLVLPKANVDEASLVVDLALYPADTLSDVIEHVTGQREIRRWKNSPSRTAFPDLQHADHVDLAEVQGQETAKRGLLVAAAGGHHVLFSGPPGAGKTLLAKVLPSILPDLTEEESIDTTRIHTMAGVHRHEGQLIRRPPFRAPHHTLSDAGLFGGGRALTPGELSLAHNGVLFLDELPEYRRNVLEVLREPLESGQVHLSRANGVVTYPARVQFLAAMNPCPCGYYGFQPEKCRCTPQQVRDYAKRISGPLLDRLDIRLQLSPVPYRELFRKETKVVSNLTSAMARKEVLRARHIQLERYVDVAWKKNAAIPAGQLEKYCVMSPAAESVLDMDLVTRQESARSLHRLIRLSRTVADLYGESVISDRAMLEAIALWRPSRKGYAQ